VILVDTSVWIDHLNKGSATFAAALERGDVLTHPFVIGEVACGTMKNRRIILSFMSNLPATPVATDEETMLFIERHRLMGKGIGYVDAHLLAAATLMPTPRFWTRDKRLSALAADLGLVGSDPTDGS
jgi:predicted nucleic acid-binding protein